MINQEIIGLIFSNTDIALIAHISPDGDTIGSCLALGRALKKIGKNVDIICQDDYPSALEFLSGISTLIKPDLAKKKYPLCIAVDCSDIKRLGSCYDIFKASSRTVNIDHHISNTYFAEFNYVKPEAAATGELIYELLIEAGTDIDKECAEAIYTAISTDTGSFCYSNTTSKTYNIAADLVSIGINVDFITRQLYRNNKLEKIMLLREVLNTLKLYFNNQVAVLTLTLDMMKKTGANDTDTESLVNYAIDIKGVQIGLLIKEIGNGTVKISIRSTEKADASKLASAFNGGGHKRAAGAVVQLNIEDAKRSILEIIQKSEEQVQC